MIIGVPKEIKNCENRVSLIPSSVKTLVDNENVVYIEKGAGVKIGFPDELYEQAGAKILDTAAEVYEKSEIIVKVKELQKEEYALLKSGQTIFSYFHLSIEPELTDILLKKKITTIAYETIQKEDGTLPLLKPMSEIAGLISIQLASRFLQNCNGGIGKLLGGVPGVHPAEIVIIGAGVVGQNAIKTALGVGASVTVLDICPFKLTQVTNIFGNTVKTAISNEYNLSKHIKKADVVIGAVRKSSDVKTNIVTEEMVKSMPKGSVIIDVSVDEGGIVETVTEATDFDNPSYEKHGVIHCAIPNLPSCVGRSAAISLNNYVLPYLLKLTTKGFIAAAKSTPELYKGINTFQGKLTNANVANALDKEYSELSMLIGF